MKQISETELKTIEQIVKEFIDVDSIEPTYSRAAIVKGYAWRLESLEIEKKLNGTLGGFWKVYAFSATLKGHNIHWDMVIADLSFLFE